MTAIIQSSVGLATRTFPLSPADGRLLVVAYGGRNGTGALGVGYVDSGEGEVGNGAADVVAVGAKVASGETTILAGSFNNNDLVLWLEVEGISSTTPRDSSSASGSGYTATAASLSVQEGDLVVLVAGIGSGGGFDAGSGYVNQWTLDGIWTKRDDRKVSDGHPETVIATYIATADGTVPITADFLNDGQGPWPWSIIGVAYAGLASPPAPGPVPGIYDKDDVFLADLPGARDVKVRVEENGVGSGAFRIRADDASATAANLRRGNLVRVAVPQVDATAFLAFFLEDGDFDLVSHAELGGRMLSFSGKGMLSYLTRAIWLAQSFVIPWWPAYFEAEEGPPGPADIGAISFRAGTYARYTVSGGHASSPIHFTTGGFTAYYDTRRVYTRTGTTPIRLVHLSSGASAGWYVHPYGPGVTDYKKTSAYRFGNSILMSLLGTGTMPGETLFEIVGEVQAADRPDHPWPLLTIDFDATTDSDGDPWSTSAALSAVSAELGDDMLSTVSKLVATGVLDVELGIDFLLHAWNAPHGRDLASASFATGKVRFVAGVNIADDLTREINDDPPVGTFAEAVGSEEGAIGRAVLPTASDYRPREIPLRGDTADLAALDDLAASELAYRLLHSDSAAFNVNTPIVGAEDELAGLYLPGPSWTEHGNYWIGDFVRLHTGTGETDFDEETLRVAAITFSWTEAKDLRVIVELISALGGADPLGFGSIGSSSVSGGVSSGGSAGATSDLYQPISERDQANGYPSLDETGNVPIAELASLSWKPSVRFATTAPVTLATGFEPADVVDGVTLAEGDHFLAKDQASPAENGIYIVAASGAPVRRPDFVDGSTLLGAAVLVREGAVNSGTLWRLSNTTIPDVGTDALDFEALVGSLSALEAAVFGYQAHGATGATETFDSTSAGWHSATLDANSVFTFVAPTTGVAGQMLLELAQDGTGGRTITLPGSVINGATLAAGLDPGASRTTIYIFLTRDGGANWYGFIAGGGIPVGASTGLVYNVQDYGAVGDDSTDDTAAIVAAMDASDATGGGIIYFPPTANAYKITSRIVRTSGTSKYHLLGGGPRYGPARVHQATANTGAFKFAPATGTDNRVLAPIVENLAIVGAGGASSGIGLEAENDLHVDGCFVAGFYVGIRLGVASFYSVIRNTTVTDCDSIGIHLANTNNTTIDSCRITGLFSPGGAPIGTLFDGIVITGGFAQRVVNCSIEYFTGYGIAVEGGGPVTIEGNYFETQQSTTGFAHVWIGNTSQTHSAWVVGNYFQGDGISGFSAIKLDNAVGFHILGNRFGVNNAIGISHTGGSSAGFVWGNVNSPAGTFTLPSDTVTAPGGAAFATPAIVLGSAAAAGSAGTVIRSDATIVAFDATVPVDQAFGDAAATGSAAFGARRDHRHGMPAAPSSGVGPLVIADGHSTPLVFADIVQTDAGDDFIYSDP